MQIFHLQVLQQLTMNHSYLDGHSNVLQRELPLGQPSSYILHPSRRTHPRLPHLAHVVETTANKNRAAIVKHEGVIVILLI